MLSECKSCGHKSGNKFQWFCVLFYFVGSISCFVVSGITIGMINQQSDWGIVFALWGGAVIMLLLGFQMLLMENGR